MLDQEGRRRVTLAESCAKNMCKGTGVCEAQGFAEILIIHICIHSSIYTYTEY